MTTSRPDFSEFMCSKVGKNWVLARRSPSIITRYGKDVVCLSQEKYAALQKEYDELYEAPARRLADAAPHMLEALKEIVRIRDEESDGIENLRVANIAREAIAKATAA